VAKKVILTAELMVDFGSLDNDTASKPLEGFTWEDIGYATENGAITGKVLCVREVGTEEEEQEKPGKNIIIVVEGGVVQAVGTDIPELDAIPLLNTEVLDRDDEGCGEDDDEDTIDDRLEEMKANGMEWIY
jgi:hypothetical protein